MPGIVGIINQVSQEKNRQDLGLMIQSMLHESTYTWGTYVNPALGVYAGWICHPGSFSDCMPVFNERKELVLLLSGETYEDSDPTVGLKRRGHDVDEFNATYLIHLYEDEGERFIERLNGWFSGLLIDLRDNKIILFNDRYGMQRIYFHENGEGFWFSSEAKALLRIKPELREIDARGLGEVLTCSCVLENRTLFRNIYLLPGGSTWTLGKGRNVKKSCYFRVSQWEDQSVLSKEHFYGRVQQTFAKILPRYFNGNQRIGMSLTSGLDTRVIMSYRDHQATRLPCYTFSGIFDDLLDAKIGKKVAEACQQPHEVIRLDSTFFSLFPSLAEKTVYITDGCHDVSGAYDIYFNSVARDIAPIRMTGKFGDEVLTGHTMLKRPKKLYARLFDPDFNHHLLRSVQTLVECKKGHSLSFGVLKEIPWREYGRLSMENCKLTLRTPYMDNDLVGLMYQAPRRTSGDNDIRLRLIRDGNPDLLTIMTDRGTAGKSNLVFSKAAQMVFYTLFKGEYVYLYELPHWANKLDYLCRSLRLERLIIGRYQLGYYRVWFRRELASFVKEILLDRKTLNRPYLNREMLEKALMDHTRGLGNYVNEINKILTVELIHRLLIERP